MKKVKWQVPLKSGDEQDYLTRWHHWCHKRPGQRPAIKRAYQRRVRQHVKGEIRREVSDATVI